MVRETRRRFLVTAAGLLLLPTRSFAQMLDIRPRTTKPKYGASVVDASSPYIAGLQSAWLLNEGGGQPLLSDGRNVVTLVANDAGGVGTVTWSPTTLWGIGLDGSTSSLSRIEIATTGMDMGSGNFSVYYRVRAPSPSGTKFVAGAGGQDAAWGLNSSNWTLFFAGVASFDTTATVTAGHYYGIGMSWRRGSQVRFMIHDYSAGTITFETKAGGGTPTSGGFQAMIICARASSSEWGDYLFSHTLWQRELSDSELLGIDAEPYAFLKPKLSTFFAFPFGPAAQAPPPAVTTTPERTKTGVGL